MLSTAMLLRDDCLSVLWSMRVCQESLSLWRLSPRANLKRSQSSHSTTQPNTIGRGWRQYTKPTSCKWLCPLANCSARSGFSRLNLYRQRCNWDGVATPLPHRFHLPKLWREPDFHSLLDEQWKVFSETTRPQRPSPKWSYVYITVP